MVINCHEQGLFANLAGNALPIRIKHNCFVNGSTPHVVAQPLAKTSPKAKKLNFRAILG